MRCIFTAATVMPRKISILVLTHNRPDDLLLMLQSLALQQDLDNVLEEVLILNNASTQSYKEVTDYIEEHAELKLNYIFSNVNHGVAKGRNILMRLAKGDILFTIDDDMEFPQRNALKRISVLFDEPLFQHHNTGVITLRVIYHNTQKVQETVFPHKMYKKYKDKTQFLTLYFAGGANIMKKEILSQTGYFPENFFYGMEEYDLCYRILDAGYTIGYDASVTIEHKESPYGRQANYKKLYMQWVNKTKVAWRYLPFIYYCTTALLWSAQYIIHATKYPGYFLKGWYDVLRIPFTEKRRRVKKSTLQYLRRVEARLWY